MVKTKSGKRFGGGETGETGWPQFIAGIGTGWPSGDKWSLAAGENVVRGITNHILGGTRGGPSGKTGGLPSINRVFLTEKIKGGGPPQRGDSKKSVFVFFLLLYSVSR